MIGFGKFSPEIEKEIDQKGYHILNPSLPLGSYPNVFPKYQKIKEIRIGCIYAVRLFVKITKGNSYSIDSGMIDIKIIMKAKEDFIGEIITLLPGNFPVSKGQNIPIKSDEILFEQKGRRA